MSEYQYFEFRAIDRPLTQQERRRLRDYSTRAEITAVSFRNEYHFGNFKGDPDEWMGKYFDAYLYYSNFGVREVKLAVPLPCLTAEQVEEFGGGEGFWIQRMGKKWVITFCVEELYEDEWECGSVLADILPARDELINGDLRLLYLGWLLRVQGPEGHDPNPEPPLPPDLRTLSSALQELVRYFDIDQDLLDEAAELSPAARKPAKQSRILEWISGLPSKEKDEILAALMENRESGLIAELWSRYRETEPKCPSVGTTTNRTSKSLWMAAEGRRARRLEDEARAALRKKVENARSAAKARAEYLHKLSGSQDRLWEEVESLVQSRNQKNYDQALEILKDLDELAARGGEETAFAGRLLTLRETHQKKVSFIDRLSALERSAEDLVVETQSAIDRATSFDPSQRNQNFDYDSTAYQQVECNLKLLVESDRISVAMDLATGLMVKGSAQIEASDEGLMQAELESAIRAVVSGLRALDIPKPEVVAWCDSMRASDRLQGIVCKEDLTQLRKWAARN